MNSLLTDKKNSWCPGCGNFGILNAIQKTIHTLIEKGFDQDSLVMTSGIGCHGKIFDYLKLSGFYSLHGRAMSTAQGIKIGNPDLTVLMFGGDGDSMGEGLEHTLFAAKRNENITMILHNNGVYGLTTGQFSPLSKKGYKGPSSPFGNIEEPFNPLPLIIEAGATFVARSYSAKIEHVTQMLVKGIEHKGFSFIEILQPCVSFNNTYELFNERVQLFEEDLTHEQAILKAKSKDPVYIGVFRQFDKDVFSEGIIPDHYKPNNPDKLMTRKEMIRNML